MWKKAWKTLAIECWTHSERGDVLTVERDFMDEAKFPWAIKLNGKIIYRRADSISAKETAAKFMKEHNT